MSEPQEKQSQIPRERRHCTPPPDLWSGWYQGSQLDGASLLWSPTTLPPVWFQLSLQFSHQLRNHTGHQKPSLQPNQVFPLICCYCSVAKSCPTLWDPIDCSKPGSSVHGVLQATILQWVCHFLKGIFPDQGLNPCLLHWQGDSLPRSHQGRPFPLGQDGEKRLMLIPQ